MSEKSWNQIEDYVWKWYPILIRVALLEEENKKPFITHENIGTHLRSIDSEFDS